jgi:bifunctional non-homologous end joining protein LigD
VRFVEPVLVVEVRFTEWTASGNIRHPTFLGTRTDKDPHEVVRERAR